MDLFSQPPLTNLFNGSDYVPKYDDARLKGQMKRIYDLMKDGKFRTLQEIEQATGDPQASISGQLRNFRKLQYGSMTVNKQIRGDRERGLYEYQLIVK